MATTGRRTGRPSLGDRHVMTARVPIPVRDEIDAIAERFGTDRSTILADLACAVTGHPDLARRLRFTAELIGPTATEEGLPLAM